MKLTFLSPCIPGPVRHGGQVRATGLVRCLAGFTDVEVLAIGEPGSPEALEGQEILTGLGVRLEVFQATGPGPSEADARDTTRPPDAASHFRSPALRERLIRARPDVLHVEELVMAQYAEASSAPAVLDRQKVDADVLEALAPEAGNEADALRREATRFRRWDAALASRFAHVLVLGAGDRDRLLGTHARDRIAVVPNGVDARIVRPASRSDRVDHVLLYGALDYGPNAAALALFFREVWPRLREELPELKTLIVGSGAAPDDVPRGDPRVELRGFVADILPLLQGPGALLVPLRVGGGVRNKILEALAAGLPVVSTGIGAEDLGLEAGQHYLRAETPDEMIAALKALVATPERSRTLSVEGARHVDAAGFRWANIARRLEPLYRELQPRRSAGGRARVLLVGVGPGPSDVEAHAHSFPGHRTEQFARALSGCDVEPWLLDEEGQGGGLSSERHRAAGALADCVARFRPDVLVAAGGYHAARVLADVETERPRWFDLAGDLAAEGQLRAADAGDALAQHLAVLRRALETGDRFSVVGPSQRLALLGQLGLAGRLVPEATGREPVAVMPVACAGPPQAPPLPPGGLRILLAGGYNTWLDVDTLWRGLDEALRRNASIEVVSTGGPVPAHATAGHAAFWKRAWASPHAGRVRDLGRVTRREFIEQLERSHVVLAVSRFCVEAELGSRLRLVEAAAWGRVPAGTRLGDLATDIGASGAGVIVPEGDAAALAGALLRLAEDRGVLEQHALAARRLWEDRYTEEATGAPLAEWVRAPERWPASASSASVEAALLSAHAELGLIRGSLTFRALRFLDRLLGR